MSQARDLTFGIEKPPRSAIRHIAAIQPETPKRQLWPTSRLANTVKIAHSLLPLQAMLQKCSARQEKIIPAIRPALSLSIPMFLRLSR